MLTSTTKKVGDMMSFSSSDVSYAPPPFGAQVRYNYVAPSETSTPVDRTISAPGHTSESLPPAVVYEEGAKVSQVVQGTVPHLPYEFRIHATRRSDADPGILVVEIMDPATRRAVPGFPRTIPDWQNALTERYGIELPLTDAHKTAITNARITTDKAGTYVNLVLGFDLK